jgi:hypothetical protein
MLRTTIAVALAVLLPAIAAARGEGRVLQATATRAYLDAGADDGLAADAEVVFHRAGAEVGRCRLEVVTARSSACVARGVRPGDTFALPARPVREEPKLLAAPLTAEQLRAQAAVLAAAPLALVEFKAPDRASGPSRTGGAEVELSEVAWVATSGGAYVATRAGVNVRAAELGYGLRLDVDAQAVRWTSRPTDPGPRFRPKDDSQLYVWQAAVSREPSTGLALSLGRILPWRIPGSTILDGATAGWRGDAWEAGAFAGFVPKPTTLGPASDRAAGGGYWSWEGRLAKGVTVLDEGRLAVVRSPELGTRLEAETRAAARLGRPLDLSGSVRLGFGGDVTAPGNVDAARLELSTRPAKHVRVAGWFAYDGLELPADAEPAVYAGHARRLEGTVAWEEPGFRLAALGGASKDLASGLDRTWVGPTLDLPRLFARRGGLSLGYLEEMGWSDGRSAWVQAIFRPWDRLRLLGRVAWAHASAYALMKDDVAATLALVADLSRTFSARLTLNGRSSIPEGEGSTPQAGGSVFATVAARY